jgi:alanyl-tRNA synthetase
MLLPPSDLRMQRAAAATAAAMTQLEWPGARVRAAFNEFFQSKAHTFWSSNAVVSWLVWG